MIIISQQQTSSIIMRIIHTADWHIGQTFFDYERKEEHIHFFAWLHEQIRINKPDILLVAGDIFDSPNPSAESQKLYYSFLFKVTSENPKLQIIIIAGNHDSAARLEAPNPIIENMNITVRGIIKRTKDNNIDFDYLTIPLDCGGYCLAVPYLRQGDYPNAESYSQGVRKMYTELFERIQDLQQPIIAMGHLHATGSEINENDQSERNIIGGLECILPDSFSQDIKYTALGHLHRGQRVSGRDNVRYAGAPLPMSFAEKNNKQGVTLITIEDTTTIERLEYDTLVKLLSIPNKPLPLNKVLDEIALLPDGKICSTSPYLEVEVLITEPEPSLKFQIEKALESKSVRLVRTVGVTNKQETESKAITFEELQNINPLEMATEIFKRKYGIDEMPNSMKILLQNVIEDVDL